MTLSNYNIPVINNLRGVAATMVCFYHFVVQTVGYIDTEWIRDVFHYGDHGVYMFFVISGIVIPLSMIKSGYDLDHWSKFILKRFIRLEPPTRKEYTVSPGVTIIVLPLSVSIAALLTLLIIYFASNNHNKYLGFLGAISYSLYLTHQITGTPVINFLSHHFRETYQKPIVILAGFAVSICCAYVLYRWVELPSMRWSKSIRYKEKPVII